MAVEKLLPYDTAWLFLVSQNEVTQEKNEGKDEISQLRIHVILGFLSVP